MQIEKFDVVWNGGVRSTVDANVGFHIQSNAEDGQVDHFMMKRVLNLCQSHEDLHNKVVENTKHQLFDGECGWGGPRSCNLSAAPVNHIHTLTLMQLPFTRPNHFVSAICSRHHTTCA